LSRPPFPGSFREERDVETASTPRGFPMRPDVVAGAAFPDCELYEHTPSLGGLFLSIFSDAPELAQVSQAAVDETYGSEYLVA
jgi:hypothetical protein